MKIIKILFWIIVFLVIVSAVFLLLASKTKADENPGTNISYTEPDYYAWNDTTGWWDFHNTHTVKVWGTKIEGYASSAVGEISLDCFTSPLGNICGTSNYGICNGPGTHQPDGSCPGADASGVLTGYAWNDTIGWISFNCVNHGGCGFNYKVTIDSSGDFQGWAWNDVVGWIKFNCVTAPYDCDPAFKINTSWRSTSSIAYLESAVFDTQTPDGAVLNSIIWQGIQNANGTVDPTYVDFQIAISNNSDGPWIFQGPGGYEETYYSASCEIGFKGGTDPSGNAPPNTPICIDPEQVNNYLYFRYKVRLRSNLLQTDTPRIDDIILNFSK